MPVVVGKDADAQGEKKGGDERRKTKNKRDFVTSLTALTSPGELISSFARSSAHAPGLGRSAPGGAPAGMCFYWCFCA